MKTLTYLRNLIRSSKPQAVQLVKTQDSRCLLLSKTEFHPIEEIKESTHIPDNAVTYSFVSIGKKGDSGFNRSILTFQDKNKSLIRKIFTGNNIQPRIRDYERETLATNNWKKILERRHITTKQLNARTQSWEPVSEENQYIHTLTSSYIYPHGFSKKLHIDKNVYEYKDGKESIQATITEYPSTLHVEDENAKKVLGVNLVMDNNTPQIESILPENNQELPQNDRFLPYRFLVGEKKQTALTQMILDRKKVGNLGIGVIYSRSAVPQNATGLFNNSDGNIYYAYVTKSHPIRIAAHEGEHAYQYALIGRLGKLNTKYGLKCQETLPPVTNVREMEKGYNYLVASEKYPVVSETEDLRKNKDYWLNELEIRARQAEGIYEKIYNKGRRILQKMFPYSISTNNF